jgi:hypothetical protein
MHLCRLMKKLTSSVDAPKQILIVNAWIAMFLASNLTIIIWRELASGEPYWWPWVHAIGLATLFAVTLVRADLKPLRGFILVLLFIYFLGLGGGWQWGLIPFVRASSVWINWESQAPWALSAIGTHLLRLLPALVIMLSLLLMGLKRRDFFLVKGEIDAPVEPTKLLGMKKPEPWTRIGSIFAAIFTVVMFVFLMLSWKPSPDAFVKALPLIPVSLLIAAMNAFNEEFTLRAAPLSVLLPVIGKQQALMITTTFFGLGHFYGVPNGVLGVLLSGFLGWFLGKSQLETKGFFWAWIIHFLPDALIFTFYAMSVV